MKACAVSLVRAVLLLASISTLAAPVQAARFADNRYACQVITVSEKQGLVMVRMNTLDEALSAAALAQQAQTRDDIREPVMQVVECVEYPDGQFADAQFRGFIELLPR